MRLFTISASCTPPLVWMTSTCSGSYRSLRTSVTSADTTRRKLYLPGIATVLSIFASVSGPPRSARTPASTVTVMDISFSGTSIGLEWIYASPWYVSYDTVKG